MADIRTYAGLRRLSQSRRGTRSSRTSDGLDGRAAREMGSHLNKNSLSYDEQRRDEKRERGVQALLFCILEASLLTVISPTLQTARRSTLRA